MKQYPHNLPIATSYFLIKVGDIFTSPTGQLIVTQVIHSRVGDTVRIVLDVIPTSKPTQLDLLPNIPF